MRYAELAIRFRFRISLKPPRRGRNWLVKLDWERLTAAMIPAVPAPKTATLVFLHLPLYGEASDGVRSNRRDRTRIVK